MTVKELVKTLTKEVRPKDRATAPIHFYIGDIEYSIANIDNCELPFEVMIQLEPIKSKSPIVKKKDKDTQGKANLLKTTFCNASVNDKVVIFDGNYFTVAHIVALSSNLIRVVKDEYPDREYWFDYYGRSKGGVYWLFWEAFIINQSDVNKQFSVPDEFSAQSSDKKEQVVKQIEPIFADAWIGNKVYVYDGASFCKKQIIKIRFIDETRLIQIEDNRWYTLNGVGITDHSHIFWQPFDIPKKS